MPKKIELNILEKVSFLKWKKSHTYKEAKWLLIRIEMLILIKEKRFSYVSTLATHLEKERHTINAWMKKYKEGGLVALMTAKNKNNAKRVLPDEAKRKIEKMINEEYGDLIRYSKLLRDVNSEFQPEIKYGTLYKFARRVKSKKSNYKSNIKIKGERFLIPKTRKGA